MSDDDDHMSILLGGTFLVSCCMDHAWLRGRREGGGVRGVWKKPAFNTGHFFSRARC